MKEPETHRLDGCSYIVYKGKTENPLILLHGYSFTSAIWREVRLLDMLEDKQISYLSLDMPYGKVSDCIEKNRDTQHNVLHVKKVLKKEYPGTTPILLGASLGGYISLVYGTKYPIIGLILIGPVWSNRPELIKHYSRKAIPILLIYGGDDKIVPRIEMERFKERTKNTRLIVYEGAPHPAYLKYPDAFCRDTINFITRLI